MVLQIADHIEEIYGVINETNVATAVENALSSDAGQSFMQELQVSIASQGKAITINIISGTVAGTKI